jgi:hypothetical protein
MKAYDAVLLGNTTNKKQIEKLLKSDLRGEITV